MARSIAMEGEVVITSPEGNRNRLVFRDRAIDLRLEPRFAWQLWRSRGSVPPFVDELLRLSRVERLVIHLREVAVAELRRPASGVHWRILPRWRAPLSFLRRALDREER